MENIVQPVERAIEAKDERLKALNAIKAGSHIHELSKNVKAVEEGNLSVANVNIGIGTSESETVIESSTVAAHESTVAAEKDVNIKATGKDINIQGSEVKGENVTLNAKENINITAAEQGNVTNTENNTSSSFAGMSIGLGTGTIGVNVSGSAGKDTIDENSTSYKASSVTAKEKLEIESGKDTNLIGSKAEGEKVEANVDGDLNIESLQETNKYREESVSGGFGINTSLGENISRDISVSANVGKTNSDYKSVTEQAGIYAGKEGFDIKVENNTDLKGAVISSKAEADKNTLTTGTISFSDIKNEAEYDTKGIGMTLDANKTSGNQPSTVGQKGLIPTVPASVGDSAESTTKSGVSEGKINVTKPEKQKQDVNTLNRDTKNTLNKLDQIFDLEKIREDQETASLFGELAANGIHVLAEKNEWKEGSPEKIALHAAVGAVVAKLTNGSVMSGAVTGGTTEYLTKLILEACKGDKAQAQWVAMIVGAAISEATGGNSQLGALVAVNAIRNNRMSHDEIREIVKKIVKKGDMTEEQYNAYVDIVTRVIENEIQRGMAKISFDARNLYDKAVSIGAANLTIFGGWVEMCAGLESTLIKGKIGKVQGFVFKADGCANGLDGLGQLGSVFTGETYELNFVRSFAKQVSPEHGAAAYDMAQTTFGLSGIIDGKKVKLGIAVVDLKARKIFTNMDKDEKINGTMFMEPLIINSRKEKFWEDLDFISNLAGVIKNITNASQELKGGKNGEN